MGRVMVLRLARDVITATPRSPGHVKPEQLLLCAIIVCILESTIPAAKSPGRDSASNQENEHQLFNPASYPDPDSPVSYFPSPPHLTMTLPTKPHHRWQHAKGQPSTMHRRFPVSWFMLLNMSII
ncbi:uncharacterized protein BDV17DRAFT_271069 [Aspergillus undulatus]|uniref:uncharacterized protein n=1 Tax=Aspergillus undulatus TaxID=1810928 RepID=UPI003CCD51BF